MTGKRLFIALFFLIQIALIFYQLNRGTNFFNWSMYHTCIYYEANVTIDGKELNDNEFFERYKMNKSGIEGKALTHLKRKLVQREKVYNEGENVVIELYYTENTHKNIWNWKSQ